MPVSVFIYDGAQESGRITVVRYHPNPARITLPQQQLGYRPLCELSYEYRGRPHAGFARERWRPRRDHRRTPAASV